MTKGKGGEPPREPGDRYRRQLVRSIRRGLSILVLEIEELKRSPIAEIREEAARLFPGAGSAAQEAADYFAEFGSEGEPQEAESSSEALKAPE